MGVYQFLIPLLLGFALTGTSAFTGAYSRLWGERGGQMATSILRNFTGMPLWLFGFVLAWRAPAPPLFTPIRWTTALGWLLIAAGSVPVVWGHLVLGWRTHMPSVRDTLVRHSLYAHVRHPIYLGALLVVAGLGLLKPTTTAVLACALGLGWLVIQARLEEVDLAQRLPAYREYMREVPRFLPRLRRGARRVTGGRVAGLTLWVLVLTALAGVPAAAFSDDALKTRTVPVEGGGSYTGVTAAGLASMLEKKDFPLINVHIPYEGEIEGTDLFIPFDAVAANPDRLPADKGHRLVLYCRSGRMSAIAARALVKLGYTDVWHLDGGMIAWEQAGYRLVHGRRGSSARFTPCYRKLKE